MAVSVRPDEYAGPVLASVALHVVVVLLMVGNLVRCDSELAVPEVPQHVRAVVIEKPAPRRPVAPTLPTVEIPKIEMPEVKPAEIPKLPPMPPPKVAEKGLAKPEPKPTAKPAEKPKPALPAPDFTEALAQEEKSHAQREKQQREAAEKAAQEASVRSAQLQKAVAEYTALIKAEVERRWVRPPSIRPGLYAEFRIRLLPGGDLQDVKLTRSSGDAAFDKSGENAIRLAGRLPVPADPALFNAAFRQFSFRFKPEGP